MTLDPNDPRIQQALGLLEEVMEHSRGAALDQATARSRGAVLEHGTGPMVPDDDPRIDVIVMADLVAAPIGTRIEDTDRSWRQYARRLLAAIDDAAAPARSRAELIAGRVEAMLGRHRAEHPTREPSCGICDIRAQVAIVDLFESPQSREYLRRLEASG